ncbi:MAG: NAD-dependent succinate-semialdehyde dehydrogenase [bacterium]
MPITSINPSTGLTEKEFEEYSPIYVAEIINNVNTQWKQWKNISFIDRGILLKRAASILVEKKEYYGKILTLEMGKTIKQAIAEVEKCAWVCNYYAQNTQNILKNEIITTDASESYVQFDPLGIILAVMPWNFPFWQVFRFAAPALMAGNVCLLKHASNVPQCALAIEEIFFDAGFPKDCFRTLLIGSNQVTDVINNPFVKAITLTGSEFAGKSVASQCGNNLKKTVMELGGSDPFIVFEDSDLEKAAETAVTARLLNNGQSCIAAKRFIIVESVYQQFLQLFIEKMRKIKIGNPLDYDTDLGPIARQDLLSEIENQVAESVHQGATIAFGGNKILSGGFYYEHTILTDVKKGQPAYNQEIFGPVASVIKAKDEEEAIFYANDTNFGLGASLWTNNPEKIKKYIPLINAGSVFVNGMVKSDPRLPFGGINLSGYGRELSHYGIKEFVNIKTVWIK